MLENKISFFENLGFSKPFPSLTEKHFHVNKFLSSGYQIDAQSAERPNGEIYTCIRLIGRKHVEEENSYEDMDYENEDILEKTISQQIKEWESYYA